jgi:hypothetical protein
MKSKENKRENLNSKGILTLTMERTGLADAAEGDQHKSQGKHC